MADIRCEIYIIDDDSSICRGLKRLMSASGYIAHTFTSAHTFLAAGLPCDNSCIILDVAMPDMDGLELQAELANLGCTTPIIFITALPDPTLRSRAKFAGAAGFFQKPVDGVALLDAIKWIVTGWARNASEDEPGQRDVILSRRCDGKSVD